MRIKISRNEYRMLKNKGRVCIIRLMPIPNGSEITVVNRPTQKNGIKAKAKLIGKYRRPEDLEKHLSKTPYRRVWDWLSTVHQYRRGYIYLLEVKK